MPVLRGHHLVCLHFFKGEGYDAEFIKNLEDILDAGENNKIEVCSGADDICGKCPHLRDGQCENHENAEEEIKEMDDTALRLLKVSPGVKIRWSRIRERLPEIFLEWYGSYCGDCDWRMACEKSDLFRKLRK